MHGRLTRKSPRLGISGTRLGMSWTRLGISWTRLGMHRARRRASRLEASSSLAAEAPKNLFGLAAMRSLALWAQALGRRTAAPHQKKSPTRNFVDPTGNSMAPTRNSPVPTRNHASREHKAPSYTQSTRNAQGHHRSTRLTTRAARQGHRPVSEGSCTGASPEKVPD